MTVKRLSTSGSSVTPSTIYPDMLAGYGDFGALQRIAYAAPSGTNQVNFNNIPQNYQDLRLVMFFKSDDASNRQAINIYPNTSAASTHSNTYLYGNGTSAISTRGSNTIGWFTYDAGTSAPTTSTGVFVSSTMDVLNYANTSTYKTALIRTAMDNNGSGQTLLSVHLWSVATAFTSLQLNCAYGNFVAGTTFELFGVKASNA